MKGMLSLKGIIVPCRWDDQGGVTSVAISAAGEKEYPIEMNGMGKSLLKHVSHEVFLEGVLKLNSEDENQYLRVQFYELNN